MANDIKDLIEDIFGSNLSEETKSLLINLVKKRMG